MVQTTYLHDRLKGIYYALRRQYTSQSEAIGKFKTHSKLEPIQLDVEIYFSVFSEYQQNVTICQFSFMYLHTIR